MYDLEIGKYYTLLAEFFYFLPRPDLTKPDTRPVPGDCVEKKVETEKVVGAKVRGTIPGSTDVTNNSHRATWIHHHHLKKATTDNLTE